jgi:hypothetical protein
MQEHFTIAAHGEQLSIRREAQRGDHGRLMVDGGRARRRPRTGNRPWRRTGSTRG